MIRKPDAGEREAMRPAAPPPAHHLRSITDGTTSFGPRAALMAFGIAALVETALPFAIVAVPLTLLAAAGWWLLYRDEQPDIAAAFRERRP